MNLLRKPFGYEPILTKDDIKKTKRKEQRKLRNWKSVLYRIWLLVDEQRSLLIAVLALVFLSSSFALIGPLIIGHIIDYHIVSFQKEGLAIKILWLIIVYIGLSITMYFQNYWMVGIAQQTVYRLRTNLFAQLQKLPVSFFDERQHGELMSRVTNDIENVSQTLNTSFIQVFSSVITLTGTLIVMIYLSPLLTVLTMIIVPIMFIAMKWITRRTSVLFKEQQASLGDLNGMIEETISGQRIVKAFSQEERMLEQFEQKSARIKQAGFWALTYSGFIPKVMNMLNNLAFAIVACIGGVLALKGDSIVTIGTIVIFSEYARQFTRPLNDLSNQFNTVLSAVAGAERVFAIMDEEQEQDSSNNTNSVQLKGEVQFSGVTFRYAKDAEQQTIDRISFHVKEGETVAFVGATGAGKTTVMQLLARFYEPNEGVIRIDGIPIQQLPRQTLRQQMAFVLQDPFLFETSVRDNIRYGKLEANDEEIVEAAKKANAHSFIQKLPNGYDTILTADGGEISQGQKQLLSIARALIADPVILLLDEATSSIDTVTELAIQEALERLMEGRTSFVIAHRLNTIQKADKVFVLHQGKLIEQGTQEELIEQQGVYYSMLADAKV